MSARVDSAGAGSFMFVGVHYYVLFHRDLNAGRAWYESLGFSRLHGGEHGEFFGLPGGGQLMIHPNADGAPAGAKPQLYVTVKDVDACVATAERLGGKVLQPLSSRSPVQTLTSSAVTQGSG